MKILVTGASGFVGSEIVAELAVSRIETAGISRRERNPDSRVAALAENYFRADVSVAKSLKAVEKFGKIDALVHSAGLAHQFGDVDRRAFYKTNVLGTANTLDLAARMGAEHFVLISSTAVYGTGKPASEINFSGAVGETDDCRPETPYAESKLEAERTALDFCRRSGMRLTILRLSPVLGEGGAGNVARLIEAIDKRRFVWIGDGKNLKSLIYKGDAAAACVGILKRKKAENEIFNVAGEPISMNRFVERIAASLGRKIPNISVPPNLLNAAVKLNSRTARINRIDKLGATIRKWLADEVYLTEKIEGAYDFKPKTSTLDALERQIADYRNRKK